MKRLLTLTLILAAVLSLIAAGTLLWGLRYGNNVPSRPHLVCKYGGEVIFDQPFDRIETTATGFVLTLDGHRQAVEVPQGVECK